MYGWRGKIGIIIPSTNTTMEPEMWKMAPEGVSVHCDRMYAIGCSRADLAKQDEDVAKCARLLGTADMDVIIYGCTSGSFVSGLAWERNLQDEIETISGCRSLTTTRAVLQALECFGCKRITIVSPYNDDIAAAETAFFGDQGYEIVSSDHLGFDLGADIRSQVPQKAYELAKGAVTAATEMLFISCTNFRSLEVVQPLEQDLGIPVITSNQASMWAALTMLGINTTAIPYGSLFQQKGEQYGR